MILHRLSAVFGNTALLPARDRRAVILVAIVAMTVLVAACNRSPAPAQPDAAAPAATTTTAPPPPEVPSSDPNAQPVQRAAPPMPPAVALGVFTPVDAVAKAATGRLTIEDMAIRGANGASFVTERVAIVRGNDPYNATARYADTMMIVPEQTVELRRVIEQTPPKDAPGDAFCGEARTGYFALAKVREGDTDVIKLMALQGEAVPAASASDITLCQVTSYSASAK